MKLKIVSLLLFVLFCVVVVFPGYGRTRSLVQPRGETVMQTSPEHSISGILLKCLSSGINMVEEERTNEQEDDDNPQEAFFVSSYPNPTVVSTQTGLTFSDYRLISGQCKHSDIFSPPDCSC